MTKTVREIVEMVAKTYNQNNRSISGNDCVYNGPDGRHCAFAMMVEDKKMLDKYEGTDACVLLEKFGNGILKEEYRGHKHMFYYSVQLLHDTENHWNACGLTQSGRAAAEQIIRTYSKEWNTDDTEKNGKGNSGAGGKHLHVTK